MKTISFLSLIAAILLLSSCEITREVSINADGSGKLNSTIDMSSIIGLAKMSGQGKDMGELENKKMDTTISMATIVDSLENFSPEEKKLAAKGTLGIVMNLEEEKFVTKMDFPFTTTEELSKLTGLASKAMQQTIKKQLAGKDKPEGAPAVDDAMPEGSIEDYFTTSYTKGVIEKKLIAAKYADIANDKGMQAMKEMSGQGMPMNTTLIFNLPRAAKKVEGKNVKLSDDKKKVTITEPLDDFFEDGKNLEFKIEY